MSQNEFPEPLEQLHVLANRSTVMKHEEMINTAVVNRESIPIQMMPKLCAPHEPVARFTIMLVHKRLLERAVKDFDCAPAGYLIQDVRRGQGRLLVLCAVLENVLGDVWSQC